MQQRTTVLAALTALLLLETGVSLVARPADRPTPAPEPHQEPTPLGRRVDDFRLRDFRGREHSLSELADRKLVVVVFLGTGCPLARAYGPRLADLQREYEPRSVGFLGVDANAQDSLADLAAYARRHQLPFPLLRDAGNRVADALSAMRTPEAFVLDGERVVRYWGRVDDQYGISYRRPHPLRGDLATALDELLAGRPVSRPVLPSSGCRIGRVPRTEPHGDITYAGEVSRILQRRCVGCHCPAGSAPFPLTDYRDVAAWSSTIGEVLRDGRMPPWLADPHHGRFRNDPSLSELEKQLVFRWIEQGCPEGNPADLPPPNPTAEGWRIPHPDQVLAMTDEPFAVPAEGEIGYQYFLVDPGFTEDRYIRAAEVRPGNPSVVHHALVLLVPSDAGGPALDSLGALLDYAPGMAPTVLPEGLALHVPAGSRFLFQMHYTPNGSVQQDRTTLGLVFADPATVRGRVQGGAVVNQDIAIPPGAADYRLTAEYRVPADILLLSLSPHMHLRGRSFRFEAIYPDGRREILLDVPRYDFNWQLRYELAEPLRLPRETRLVCTGRYDNSRHNPANPDPGREVRWGDQTQDEMLIGFFAFTPAEETPPR